MGVSGIVDSIANKQCLVGEQDIAMQTGVVHKANGRISGSSRCIPWIWYGYNSSLCAVPQTAMRRTRRRTEILRVQARGLHDTISIMFPSDQHSVVLDGQQSTTHSEIS
jgi:hypothetical protein